MTANADHRLLLFIWATVLVSPLAWGASLVSMFWLTHPVCQGLPHSALVLTGLACAVLAGVGSGAAGRALKRLPRVVRDGDDVRVFLLRLALWSGLIFALVILLSIVPTAVLTPCPV